MTSRFGWSSVGVPQASAWSGLARYLLSVAASLLLGAAAAHAQSPPAESGGKPATALASFAGGCFWCMEPPFEKLPGVRAVVVGYTGGQLAHPTYEQVSAGGTGHAESVEVTYDPAAISYEKLLDVFWHNVDPTNAYGQFCDSGMQYRTAIFVADDAQRKAAEASRKALEDSGVLKRPIVTEILKAGTFWKAEEYHQKYYKKNPFRYSFYRSGCGRDARLKELWGDAAPKH
jgi:peptide-methionine (S)-S-oxide reductase